NERPSRSWRASSAHRERPVSSAVDTHLSLRNDGPPLTAGISTVRRNFGQSARLRGRMREMRGETFWRRALRRVLAFASALLSAGVLAGASATPAAAATGPCDIYGGAGQPCVAAYSTTRALLSTYGGSLYRVTRSSDNTSTNIGLQSTGGIVNAAAQ